MDVPKECLCVSFSIVQDNGDQISARLQTHFHSVAERLRLREPLLPCDSFARDGHESARLANAADVCGVARDIRAASIFHIDNSEWSLTERLQFMSDQLAEPMNVLRIRSEGVHSELAGEQ